MSQSSSSSPFITEAEVLFELELNVARKADEIARVRRFQTALNLHCWLMAEREVLGSLIAEEAAQARTSVLHLSHPGQPSASRAEPPALVPAGH